MPPSVGVGWLWTHDKKVDLPQPGSPRRSIFTVVSVSYESGSVIMLALFVIVILLFEQGLPLPSSWRECW